VNNFYEVNSDICQQTALSAGSEVYVLVNILHK